MFLHVLSAGMPARTIDIALVLIFSSRFHMQKSQYPTIFVWLKFWPVFSMDVILLRQLYAGKKY